MIKLYSAGISAERRSGGVVVSTCAVTANSKAEAVGLAIEFAENRWPKNEHYSHQAAVFEIPQFLIDAENSEGDNV